MELPQLFPPFITLLQLFAGLTALAALSACPTATKCCFLASWVTFAGVQFCYFLLFLSFSWKG
jgi:hypothetical protein